MGSVQLRLSKIDIADTEIEFYLFSTRMCPFLVNRLVRRLSLLHFYPPFDLLNYKRLRYIATESVCVILAFF